MITADTQAGIRCPIGLFEQQEPKVEVLTKAINAGRTAAEKAPNARMLIDEVKVLLDCPSYDRANPNCRLCRNFSELRLNTANLIARIGASDPTS